MCCGVAWGWAGRGADQLLGFLSTYSGLHEVQLKLFVFNIIKVS